MRRRYTLQPRTAPIINDTTEESFMDQSVDLDMSKSQDIFPFRGEEPGLELCQENESTNLDKLFIDTTTTRSSLSRVVIDTTTYKIILTDRISHPIFTTIDSEASNNWYFISKTGDVVGPLSSSQMDAHFGNLTFSEFTKIRRENQTLFSNLRRFVRSYYCTINATFLRRKNYHFNKIKAPVPRRRVTLQPPQSFPRDLIEFENIKESKRSIKFQCELSFLDTGVPEATSDEDEGVSSRNRSETLLNNF